MGIRLGYFKGHEIMPTPTPTKIDTPTRAPEQTPDPERFYQPERLCPDQEQRATKWSMP